MDDEFVSFVGSAVVVFLLLLGGVTGYALGSHTEAKGWVVDCEKLGKHLHAEHVYVCSKAP
jgi:hypothetical protein